jgi:hypothetical protein
MVCSPAGWLVWLASWLIPDTWMLDIWLSNGYLVALDTGTTWLAGLGVKILDAI